ncbi:MAG: hypothetical protein IPG61_17590 [bacterium]|nr:hypothetical protein [bacterium]
MSGNLTYRAKWNLEANWDGVQLQVSVGGGAWTPVAATRTQTASGQGVQRDRHLVRRRAGRLVTETVSLAPGWARAMRFQFVLRSDTSLNHDGFRFDWFLIRGRAHRPYSGTGDLPAMTQLWACSRTRSTRPPRSASSWHAPAGPGACVRPVGPRCAPWRTTPAPAGAQFGGLDGLDDAGQPAPAASTW